MLRSAKTALLALGLLCAAACAQDVPPFFPRESTVLEPAFNDAVELERKEATDRVVGRKMKQAKILYKLKRFLECADICEEILMIDRSRDDAVKLRRNAMEASTVDKDKNANLEADISSSDILTSELEKIIPPKDGDIYQRPVLDPKSVPFHENIDQYEDAKKEILSRKILELNLVGADLNEVLQLLFKTTGVNIIYKPEAVADKTVTIFGKNMSLGSVLDYLSRSNDIGYSIDNSIVWVYAKSADDDGGDPTVRAHMKPVIIPLKYGLSPVANSTDDKGEAEDAGGGGGDWGEGEGTSGIAGNPLKSGESDIEAMIKWMEENWPGWPPESRWYLDRKLNRLVIASSPEVIAEVRKIVEMLDVPPRQILISAHFVEIKEENFHKVGVDLGLTSPNDGRQFQVNASTSTIKKVSDQEPAETATLGMSAVIDSYKLTATLQALEEKNIARTVNAPRVIAINNRNASISIGSTYEYSTSVEAVTNTTTTDISSTSSTSFIPSGYRTARIGWTLDVIPSIGSDNKTISLHIIPTVNDKTTETYNLTVITQDSDGNNVPTEIPVPIFEEQKIDVHASVEDGQTVVIGGLYRTADNSLDRGVPFLKDVPVLGPLFRTRGNSKKRTALLIFVTAKIIRPDNGSYNDNIIATPKLPQNLDGNFRAGDRQLNDWLGDPTIDARKPAN